MFFYFSCGIWSIGLSVSINLGNINGKDVNSSFLYLGLNLCLPSLVGGVLTAMAIRGMKTWKKILLTPLMIFLRTVPVIMTSMTLIFLVMKCQSLEMFLTDKNTPNRSILLNTP